MTLLSVSREFEIAGTDNLGDPCLFPRDPVNPDYADLIKFRTMTISPSGSDSYDAFPFMIKVGDYLVGIYSEGAAHAQSQRQKMFRVKPDFSELTVITFQEGSPLDVNTSLLQGLLAPGEFIVLKNWTVRNVAGVLQTTYSSEITVAGVRYFWWSKVVRGADGLYYRTAYSTTPSWKSALFRSSLGIEWEFVSIIFEGAGQNFNETDIYNVSGSNWIAFGREDLGPDNNLFRKTSADNGLTWTVAALETTINGRQPNVVSLPNGSVLLATGKRTGTSGYTTDGDRIVGASSTGITVVRALNMSSVFGFMNRIEPMFSTDGGQGFMVVISDTLVIIAYYTRREEGKLPKLALVSFDPTFMG